MKLILWTLVTFAFSNSKAHQCDLDHFKSELINTFALSEPDAHTLMKSFENHLAGMENKGVRIEGGIFALGDIVKATKELQESFGFSKEESLDYVGAINKSLKLLSYYGIKVNSPQCEGRRLAETASYLSR